MSCRETCGGCCIRWKRERENQQRKGRAEKEARAAQGFKGHIVTFFFFFLSESWCCAAVDGCCCGSSSSSSGKRAYCRPGAEKQSFVKWPEESNNLFNNCSVNSNKSAICVKQAQSLWHITWLMMSPHPCSRTLNTLCWAQPPAWSCCWFGL